MVEEKTNPQGILRSALQSGSVKRAEMIGGLEAARGTPSRGIGFGESLRREARVAATKAIDSPLVAPLFMANEFNWQTVLKDVGEATQKLFKKTVEEMRQAPITTRHKVFDKILEAFGKDPKLQRALRVTAEELQRPETIGGKSPIMEREDPYGYGKDTTGGYWQVDTGIETDEKAKEKVKEANRWDAYEPDDTMTTLAQQAARGWRVREDIEFGKTKDAMTISENGLCTIGDANKTLGFGFLYRGDLHYNKEEVFGMTEDLIEPFVTALATEMTTLQTQLEREKSLNKQQELRKKIAEVGTAYNEQTTKREHFAMARVVDNVYHHLHVCAKTCLTREMLTERISEETAKVFGGNERKLLERMEQYLENDWLPSYENDAEEKKWKELFGDKFSVWKAAWEVNNDPELDFDSLGFLPQYQLFEKKEQNALFNKKAVEYWESLHANTREARLKLTRVKKMREFGGVPYSSEKITVVVWEEREIPVIGDDGMPKMDNEMKPLRQRIKEKKYKDISVAKLLPTGHAPVSREWIELYRQLMEQGKESQAMDMFYQYLAQNKAGYRIADAEHAKDASQPDEKGHSLNEFENLVPWEDPRTHEIKMVFRRPIMEKDKDGNDTDKIAMEEADLKIRVFNEKTGEFEIKNMGKVAVEKYEIVYRGKNGKIVKPEMPTDEWYRQTFSRDADTHCLDRVRGMKGFQTVWEWMKTDNGVYSGWMYEHVGYAVMTRIFLLTSGGINPYDHYFLDPDEIVTLPGRRPQISLRFIMEITGQGGPGFQPRSGDGWAFLKPEEFYYQENLQGKGYSLKRAQELNGCPGKGKTVTTFFGWATERILKRADRTDPITLSLIARGPEAVRNLHELTTKYHFGDHYYLPKLEAAAVPFDWDALSSGRKSLTPAQVARLLLMDLNPEKMYGLLHMTGRPDENRSPEEWFNYVYAIATAEKLSGEEKIVLAKVKQNILGTVAEIKQIQQRMNTPETAVSDEEKELVNKLADLPLTSQIDIMAQTPSLNQRLRKGFTDAEFQLWNSYERRLVLLSLCMLQSMPTVINLMLADKEKIIKEKTPAQQKEIIKTYQQIMTQNLAVGRAKTAGIDTEKDMNWYRYVLLTGSFFEHDLSQSFYVPRLARSELAELKKTLVNEGGRAARYGPYGYSQAHPLAWGLVKPGDFDFCLNWSASRRLGVEAMKKKLADKNLTEEEKNQVKKLDQNGNPLDYKGLFDYAEAFMKESSQYTHQYGRYCDLPLCGWDEKGKTSQDKRYRAMEQFASTRVWSMGDMPIYYWEDADGNKGPGFFRKDVMGSGRPDLWDPFSEYDFFNRLALTFLTYAPNYAEARMVGFRRGSWIHHVLTPGDLHGEHDTPRVEYDGVFVNLQREAKGMIPAGDLQVLQHLIPGKEVITRFEQKNALLGIGNVRESGKVAYAQAAEWVTTGVSLIPIPGGGAVGKGLSGLITDAPGYVLYPAVGAVGLGGIAIATGVGGIFTGPLIAIGGIAYLAAGKVMKKAVINAQMEEPPKWVRGLFERFGADISGAYIPGWDWGGKPEEFAQAVTQPSFVIYAHAHPKG